MMVPTTTPCWTNGGARGLWSHAGREGPSAERRKNPLRFPALLVHEGQGADNRAVTDNASAPSGWRGPARILVIDDEPSVRFLVRRLLEFDGYEVVVVDDGIRGLAAAQQQRPDAIVLDLMMPVMDGYQVLANLRTDPRTASVPVVVLTAASTVAAGQRVRDAGAVACLTKPFAPEELAASLSSAIAEAHEPPA
jgi:CheY-like chemotaxis protein